jgi:U3 small nucleolar RNA-associated protein 22
LPSLNVHTLFTAAMAPPVSKRRKLEHSDSEEESEGSFAGFDEIDDAASDASAGAEDDGGDESDVEMSGADDLDDFRDLQDGSEEEDGSEDEGADETPAPAVKATTLSKPTKRPASSLQDGVYTAESFKSNLFKLQVDELLQQVRLKYGKKEAAAENAMRTLKTMIEQIPSRDALPVCIEYHSDHSQLTNRRYPKLRNLSNRLV